MNLTSAFARPKGQKEDCFERQMFQGSLLNWFKGGFCQLMQNQGEVPRRYSPPSLGSVCMETIQEPRENLIFADVNGGIAQFISNGRPLPINSAGL